MLASLLPGFSYDIYCTSVSSTGAIMKYDDILKNKISFKTIGSRKVSIDILN